MIVALRALKLGDLLTGVPALRALRRAFPSDEVVLAAPAWLEPLALLSGAVDRIVDTAPLAPLDPSLHGASLAVNLHGRGPRSTEVLRATCPARLVTYTAETWRDDEHERVRWCRLLEEHGIPADPSDLRLAVDAERTGAVVVHPGASTGARRWPVERWAAVARALDGPVVLTGDASERTLAEQVAALAGLPDGAVLAGRTGLLDLVRLVAGARLVLCGDTGVAHVASATGTPSVVLFGPTPPAWWGPPDDGPHTVLWSGRTGDPLAEEPDPGLLTLTAEQVLGAVRTAAGSRPRP